MGVDHAFGLARGSAGCHHQRIPWFGRDGALEAVRPVRGDHSSRAQVLEEEDRGRLREPGVEGQHGVTGIPRRLERIDKAGSGRQIERH